MVLFESESGECQPVAALEKHRILWRFCFLNLEPLNEGLAFAVFHGEGGLADNSNPRHFWQCGDGVHFDERGHGACIRCATGHEHADCFEAVRVLGFGRIWHELRNELDFPVFEVFASENYPLNETLLPIFKRKIQSYIIQTLSVENYKKITQ